jgi:hypothetical protein
MTGSKVSDTQTTTTPTETVERPTFEGELRSLINRFSKENGSDTPDFILAQYMNNCLTNFNEAVTARTNWYGGVPSFSKQKLQALPTAPTKEN